MSTSPSTPTAPAEPPSPATEPREDANRITHTIKGKKYEIPADRPLYRPHGKWEWTNGHDFLSYDPGAALGSGLEGTVNLKLGFIDNKKFLYISKLTSVWDNWRIFFSSLYLNAATKYLRPLQGDCVPWIIGVRHCVGGRLGVAQDLPHPTGWREADMFLNDSQKEAIISAYQKLHDKGVLHGDVAYRHMLIGDDGKVTIIDFGFSKVVDPDQASLKAGLEACSPLDLRNEMRQVKFMLDWKDSRTAEYQLARLRNAREEKDREVYEAMAEKKTDPFERIDVPTEPLSDEEKAAPDGALRLCDLDEWSYGKSWIATRFEVVRQVLEAEVRKTKILHPGTSLWAGNTGSAAPRPLRREPTLALSTTLNFAAPSDSLAHRKNALSHAARPNQKRALEQEQARVTTTGPMWNEKRCKSHGPVRKRQRKEVLASKADSEPPEASLKAPSHESLPPGPPEFSEADIMTSHFSESSDPAKIQVIDDEVADPTSFELNAEERAFLRVEAARAFARFTIANARVQPLDGQLDQEQLNVERCRSELLRLILMLPKEDRTSLWTNMGQPDARTVLGLLPESRDPSKLTGDRAQLANTDVALRNKSENKTVLSESTAVKRLDTLSGSMAAGTGAKRDSSQMSQGPEAGPSTGPKAQVIARKSCKEKLVKRIEHERAKDSSLMPPPALLPAPRALPVVPSFPETSGSKAATLTYSNSKGSIQQRDPPSQVILHDKCTKTWPPSNPGEVPCSPSVLISFVSAQGEPIEEPSEIGWGSIPAVSKVTFLNPYSPGSSTEPGEKRKRESAEEDESSSAVDKCQPDAKRLKTDLCGLM